MAEYEALIQNLRSIDEYDTGYAKLIYEAANAIEELTDRNVVKWISVTEKLPEICERDINGNITFSGRVWSCTDFGDGFYWQQIDQYTTNCGGKWLSEVPEDDGFTPKVVAWMPLPEPPKEET